MTLIDNDYLATRVIGIYAMNRYRSTAGLSILLRSL